MTDEVMVGESKSGRIIFARDGRFAMRERGSAQWSPWKRSKLNAIRTAEMWLLAGYAISFTTEEEARSEKERE